MRAHGAGSLPLCLANQLVCFFRALRMLVGDGRQFGLDSGVDSHESDYLVSLAEQDRSKVVFLQRGVVDIRAFADVSAFLSPDAG
jgi:hypothetical protein